MQDMGQPSQDSVDSQDTPNSGMSQMSHFDTYEELRKALQQLHMMGLPGADKLLLSLEKIHVENMGQASKMMGGQEGVNSPQASSQYGSAPQ